jgi:hypothetical protein
MDGGENSLLRYLIEVDPSNYELIDDEDEEVHAMVAALEVQHSYCRSRRFVPRECADGLHRQITECLTWQAGPQEACLVVEDAWRGR